MSSEQQQQSQQSQQPQQPQGETKKQKGGGGGGGGEHQQHHGKKKEKKLSKAERQALRESQRKSGTVLNHPDDGSYGDLNLNQSQYKTERTWTEIRELSAQLEGKHVWLRGRVHAIRPTSNVVFISLRQGFSKVQVTTTKTEEITAEMVKYASKIPLESIIDVYGLVMIPKEPITSATQSDVEIIVKRLYVVSRVLVERLPFQIEDASRSEQEYEKNPEYVKVHQDTRLDNRWIDLRTTANHAIFKIQSAVGRFFRDFLTSQAFVEIHSPKLLGAASEGGANVFKLKYFGNDAFLSQSPQLYKQMALCCDLQRVFEVGPVFRAENSNTHRHLCEFTGLDLEMEFKEHYHEVLNLIGDMFIYIFKQLNQHFKAELDAVRKQYPFEDLVFSDRMLILTFKEAMGMVKTYHDQLVKEGKTKEAEELLLGDMTDFSTPSEKLLGKLVKAKYNTEFYAVDKYPLSVRPFYTMPDPFNPTLSNSYDVFLRGEEIMSGAQRVHDPTFLTERAKSKNIPVETLAAYINSFRYGTSPHAGGGVGLERVVMLFMGLDNIRKASMFPRDPKRCEP